MPNLTPVNSWSIPSLSDVPNVITSLADLYQTIDARVNPIFANSAARASAMPSPSAGQQSFLQDTNAKYYYTGSVWKRMTPYRAETVLASTSTFIDFQNIPTDLARIKLSWVGRTTASGDLARLYILVNNNSTESNYTVSVMSGTGGVGVGAIDPSSVENTAGVMTANSSASGGVGTGCITFVGWNSPHSGRLCYVYHSFQAQPCYAEVGGGMFTPTGPYSRLGIGIVGSGDFIVGSTFTLEGWD